MIFVRNNELNWISTLHLRKIELFLVLWTIYYCIRQI